MKFEYGFKTWAESIAEEVWDEQQLSDPDEIDVFVFLYPINVACSLSLACFSVIGNTKVPSSFVLVNFKGFPLRSRVTDTLARRLCVSESST